MYIEVIANSDKGNVRARNEDMILLEKQFIRDKTVSKDVILSDEERFIVAVADGMGGHRRGDIASQEVCRELTNFFYSLPSRLSSEEIIKSFKDWVQVEHDNLLMQGTIKASLKDMGTTLVGLIIYERKVFWINCGDSRIYRLRNNILSQLSTDHSLREMAGNQDAPSNVIMNSIGAGKSVFLDMVEITDIIYDNDTFLLCSDGLTDVLKDEEIEIMLLNSSIDKLINFALASGGSDNISACSVRFQSVQDMG